MKKNESVTVPEEISKVWEDYNFGHETDDDMGDN